MKTVFGISGALDCVSANGKRINERGPSIAISWLFCNITVIDCAVRSSRYRPVNRCNESDPSEKNRFDSIWATVQFAFQRPGHIGLSFAHRDGVCRRDYGVRDVPPASNCLQQRDILFVDGNARISSAAGAPLELK